MKLLITGRIGVIDGRHQVMGTYIHGVFDNDEFRRFIINQLRLRKGLDETPVVSIISNIKTMRIIV